MVNNPKIADQLLEKTFKAICKNIHQFKNSQVTFLTWALQFARSEGINYLSSADLKTGTARNTYTDAVNNSTAVNEIAIFKMIHQGYKVYEVAEILEIPVDEVKINIRKAMKQKTNPN